VVQQKIAENSLHAQPNRPHQIHFDDWETARKLSDYQKTLDKDPMMPFNQVQVPFDKIQGKRQLGILSPTSCCCSEHLGSSSCKDNSVVRPHLEKLVDFEKNTRNFFKPYDHVYDPLLVFEPGMKI
jgi:hypothetical protein